jgi:hypothetical protein
MQVILSEDQRRDAHALIADEGITWNVARYRVLTDEQREQFTAQTRAATKRRRVEQPRAEMLYALRQNCKQASAHRGGVMENVVGVMKNVVVPCTITEADLHWPTHCPVLGIELHYPGQFNHDPAGASFDRLDFTLGYVKGNVLVVSRRANMLRKDATPDELRAIADFYEFLG